jgi:hypothetical protein
MDYNLKVAKVKMDTTFQVNDISLDGTGLLRNKKIKAEALAHVTDIQVTTIRADSARIAFSLNQ